jgi:hypothetical protein
MYTLNIKVKHIVLISMKERVEIKTQKGKNFFILVVVYKGVKE